MAGRKSSITYYQSKGGFFTIHQGVTYRLATGPDDRPAGPTYLAALAEFGRVMELAQAPRAKNENTIRVVAELYLRHVAATKAANTLAIRQARLQAFLDFRATGEMRMSALKKPHVKEFIAHMREPRKHPKWKHRVIGWHDGTVNLFVLSLHACFNWAVREELIDKNPIHGLEKPTARSRGAECRVTPEMHQRALAAAEEDFRELLVVCEATGCRPSELCNAEARHFDPKLGAIVYRGRAHLKDGEVSHKTSHKDKDRIVILTGEALELVQKLVVLHPQGPLFRTPSGRWTKKKLSMRMTKLRKQAKLPPTFTLYSYRHEAHTAFLEAGGSIDDLSAIMGNSPEVIRAHYSHLLDNPQRLRKLAEEFRAGRTGSSAASAPEAEQAGAQAVPLAGFPRLVS
jgi:integrase